MDNKSLKVNQMIMNELGFEVGQNKKLIDQDTCQPVQIGGKNFIAPGLNGSRINEEFDPYNNPRLMEKLFSYFINKLEEPYIHTFYHVYDNSTSDRGYIECSIQEEDGSIGHIRSAEYCSDSVKYLDLMQRINGDTPEDLSSIDYDRKNTKPRRTKKNAMAYDKKSKY